jgi:3-hydroxy-9,10-secoandrosta-1,3,5(10)-triene-9,17-dione monooxygenase reductase component
VARDHPTAFDSAKFRQVLGHFPTGVVVVTAMADNDPVGLAIGSFASVSLDPPLVGFFPGRTSSSWPRIRAGGAFCVNILGEGQEEISRVFASKGTEKFAALGWKPGLTGSPILNDVTAYIDCTIESITEAGDHDFVVGRVVDLDVGHEGSPLIFYRGGYSRLSV